MFEFLKGPIASGAGDARYPECVVTDRETIFAREFEKAGLRVGQLTKP